MSHLPPLFFTSFSNPTQTKPSLFFCAQALLYYLLMTSHTPLIFLVSRYRTASFDARYRYSQKFIIHPPTIHPIHPFVEPTRPFRLPRACLSHAYCQPGPRRHRSLYAIASFFSLYDFSVLYQCAASCRPLIFSTSTSLYGQTNLKNQPNTSSLPNQFFFYCSININDEFNLRPSGLHSLTSYFH